MLFKHCQIISIVKIKREQGLQRVRDLALYDTATARLLNIRKQPSRALERFLYSRAPRLLRVEHRG